MVRVPLTPKNSVKKKIQLFRVENERRASGAIQKIDPGAICKDVAKIDGSKDRYVVDTYDVESTAWLNHAKDNDRLVVASIKRKDFPLVEGQGVRETLQMQAGKGLAEIINVRFLPNNIVGIDFNNAGPRLWKLVWLLKAKFPGKYDNLQFDPLFDKDIQERLTKLEAVNLVSLQIDRATFSRLAVQGDTYFDAARRVFDYGGAGILTITMKMEKPQEHLKVSAIQSMLKKLFKNPEILGEEVRASVRGIDTETNRSVTLDLINQRIIGEYRILKANENSRAVDSNDAFRVIEEAYENLRHRVPTIRMYE